VTNAALRNTRNNPLPSIETLDTITAINLIYQLY